jgi:hypothetical protein
LKQHCGVLISLDGPSPMLSEEKEMRANDLKEKLHFVAYYLFICLLKEVNIPFWGQAVHGFLHVLYLKVFVFIPRDLFGQKSRTSSISNRGKVCYTFSSQTGFKSVLVTINADVPVIMYYEKKL